MALLIALLVFLSGCQSSQRPPGPGSSGPAAPHGDSFNNGGGISEQNLVYAHRQLPRVLTQCRQGCGLSTDELALASRLVVSPLQFYSSKKTPERFRAPYQRVGPYVASLATAGSPVWADLDALYPGNRALDARESAETLVEAWAVQQAAAPALAKSLAERVGRLFSNRAQRLSLASLSQPEIGALVLDGEGTEDISLVDTVDMYSIGNRLRESAPCPNAGEPVTAWQLTNLHWLTDRDPIELSAAVRYRCGATSLSGKLVVKVPLTRGETWRMNPADLAWQYGDLEVN